MIGKRIRMSVATALVATLAASPWAVASGPLGSETTPEIGIYHGRAHLSQTAVTAEENFVALIASSDGAVYRSEALLADGSFVVEAPVGKYSVIAGTPSAAYLAGNPVQLAQGVNPAVAIRIDAQQGAGGGSAGGGSFGWGTWLIVGAIAIAAYVVVDEVTSDDEEDASPF